jgi:hypothetical protein
MYEADPARDAALDSLAYVRARALGVACSDSGGAPCSDSGGAPCSDSGGAPCSDAAPRADDTDDTCSDGDDDEDSSSDGTAPCSDGGDADSCSGDGWRDDPRGDPLADDWPDRGSSVDGDYVAGSGDECDDGFVRVPCGAEIERTHPPLSPAGWWGRPYEKAA